jgi:hypothetical protein
MTQRGAGSKFFRVNQSFYHIFITRSQSNILTLLHSGSLVAILGPVIYTAAESHYGPC